MEVDCNSLFIFPTDSWRIEATSDNAPSLDTVHAVVSDQIHGKTIFQG